MAGAHGAAADAAPWHSAGGIGQGDGWLCRHRLQVTALGSPGVWAENKRLSAPIPRGQGTWGDPTRGGRDAGGGCMATPALARRHRGPTAGTAPAGPSATCSLGTRLPLPAPAAITLMTLGSGLEKSTVPARHCRVPKLTPGCPEGSGGGGSPPASPRPQESGKLRYGNGCKAHPPRAPRRELRPVPNPPRGARASGRLPREILSANGRLKA